MFWLLLVTIFSSNPTTLLIPPFRHTLGIHRASKFFINMFLGPNFQINDPQGIVAVRMKEGDNPNTATDDHILTLFAVNSGNGQIVYNSALTKVGTFGKEGNGEKEFLRPHGITANPDGDVYIADTGNDRVVKLRYCKGELVWEKVFVDSLVEPFGVAIDSKKRVYVTEKGASRILVFDSLGNCLRSVVGGGDVLQAPTSIAVIDQDDLWNYYQENFFVVIDKGNKRITKFNLNGRLLNSVDARTIGLAEADFAYLAIDYYANVYVTDQLNHQIHKFDRNLNYLISFGKEGTGDNEFYSPRGITIWRRFGQVFIVEAEGGQYYWLGLDGYLIGCFPEKFTLKKPGTTIALYLTELAQVKVTIFDGNSQLIRQLTPEHYQKSGEVLIVWDGRDNQGRVVRPGQYRIKLEIRPTYSAPKRYFKKELEALVECVEES
jgi:hypothetical protein